MEKREDNGMQGHGRPVGEKGRGHQVEQHPGRCCSPPLPETHSRIHSKTPTGIPMGREAGPAPPGRRFSVKPQRFGNSAGIQAGLVASCTRHPPGAWPAGRGSRGGRRGAPGAAAGNRASPGKWPIPAAAGARPRTGSWQRRTWDGMERGHRAAPSPATPRWLRSPFYFFFLAFFAPKRSCRWLN